MYTSDAIFLTVNSFYQKATTDILIGYHFKNIPDFSIHIQHISSFWRWHILKTPYPSSFPPIRLMAKHIPLKIKKGELHRWVKLFNETLDENSGGLDPAHLELWKSKIEEFKNIFLQNKFLFPFD
jgi:hypothetical protein